LIVLEIAMPKEAGAAGSTFESWLEAEGILEETIEAAKRDVVASGTKQTRKRTKKKSGLPHRVKPSSQ
jgi:hypothetical protein